MMRKCANCKRAELHMETVTVNKHSADLCTTCAYTMRHNEARLQELVCSQPEHEANDLMKQQHKILSGLIAVGLVGIIGIFSLDFFNQPPASAEPPLSQIELKQLD